VAIPDMMSFIDAAPFIATYGTSHIALSQRANLQAGEVLLVHGAGGGVGLTTVELGKLMGAIVIATEISPAKLAIAKEYGADYLISCKEEQFHTRVKELTGGKGADVIFDTVGGDVFDQSMRCINWGGRLLVIGFVSGRIPKLAVNLALLKNCSIVGVFCGAYPRHDPRAFMESMQTLLGWYAEGKLKPRVAHTFPLEQAPDALNMLINHQSTGKIVLTIA
jgi:NADPH2:quinone reductase